MAGMAQAEAVARCEAQVGAIAHLEDVMDFGRVGPTTVSTDRVVCMVEEPESELLPGCIVSTFC